MAPGVAELSLEPVAKGAPELDAKAVVVGDAVVEKLDHAVKARVRRNRRQSAETIREIGQVHGSVGERVNQQFVISVVSRVGCHQHILLPERLLDFKAPFQILRRVNLIRRGEELGCSETRDCVAQLSVGGPIGETALERVVFAEGRAAGWRTHRCAEYLRGEDVGEVGKDVLHQTTGRKIREQTNSGPDHHAVGAPRTPHYAGARKNIDRFHGRKGVGEPGCYGGVVRHVDATLVTGGIERLVQIGKAVVDTGGIARPLQAESVRQLDPIANIPLVLSIEPGVVEPDVHRRNRREALREKAAGARVRDAIGEVGQRRKVVTAVSIDFGAEIGNPVVPVVHTELHVVRAQLPGIIVHQQKLAGVASLGKRVETLVDGSERLIAEAQGIIADTFTVDTGVQDVNIHGQGAGHRVQVPAGEDGAVPEHRSNEVIHHSG